MDPVKSTLASDITAIEKKIGVWLDPAHLVLLGLLILSLLGGVYLFESKQVAAAEARAQVATEVAKVAQEAAASSAIQNAAQQEQNKTIQAQMAAVTAQLQTANSQLQAANKQLVTALAAQRKTDASLSPQDQAGRWQQIVPTAKVTVTPTGFTVDPQGGLDTLQALEELPFDRRQIGNLTTEVTNDEKIIANDVVSLSSEKTAHASDLANDQKQLTSCQDETKKVQADFTVYKHKARRNYIKAFFIGVVVGFFGGHAVR
jgi:hypothetical protein